ncbi:MAG: Thioredoxin reductase [Rhodoferax sp.]|nr:Thioredoxin reductase [Rhodoferax sp.]
MATSPGNDDQARAADPEVLVIGGGPAGLTAAVYLARFRRRVALIDAGASRLARIPRSHNFPGFVNGVPGSTLLARLRRQAAAYGVQPIVGEVQRIERVEGGFEAHWQDGQLRAAKVLLATGASDVPPPMPYLSEALRNGALRYCPVCDGFEVSGQRVGVLTADRAGISEALYLRHFTPHLAVFLVEGADLPDARDAQALHEAGIRCETAPVRSIRQWDGRVTVRHGEHETSCDAVYGAFGMRVHSALATSLGAEVDDGGYLRIDRHQATTVNDLYAIGDVAMGLNQITVAVGGAAIATAAIHLALGGPWSLASQAHGCDADSKQQARDPETEEAQEGEQGEETSTAP